MNHRSFLLLISGLLLPGSIGCSRQNAEGRVAVSGTVTQNGTPVSSGQIFFRPSPGSAGPSTGGAIEGGTFEIPADRGPITGEYIIRISAAPPPVRSRLAVGKKSANQTAPTPSQNEFTRRIQPNEKLTFELISK